ncbi:MAG: PIN domain-containing protein [Deltaproteobacteria bacterium]|nr:PIN domain-containing protein [Deltaproteobacteria bacterium]
MKVAFDTSVIVPSVVEGHPQHARAAFWFRDRRGLVRIASWHAYAESWAVLTALPIEPRVSGEVAAAVLERLRRSVSFVPPRGSVYTAAVARCCSRGARSGAVYDALHLVTAESEDAELFLTFNVDDFRRLAEPDGPRILAPPDPPGLPPQPTG